MNNITSDTQIDGSGGGIDKYNFSGGITPAETVSGFGEGSLVRSYLPTMWEGIRKELEERYTPISLTGEIERIFMPTTKRIVEVLESAISLINEVLEVYDDEIERINTFSLFEEKIKYLWELREETNKNFVDIIVLLEVAVGNSHYQNYQKNQYQSIEIVLEKIKGVFITPQQAKECRKLLMDNGVDLFAPIRDWENYTVEIKKNNATK